MPKNRKNCSTRKKVEQFHLRLEEMKTHPQTQAFKYPEFKEVYDFISGLYPLLKTAIEAITIYKNPNKGYCKKDLKIPASAGGAFFIQHKVIIITKSHIPDELIACHEMLHYASRLMGCSFNSYHYEEEFALGKSIPYILSKGYGEEWIVKWYLAPYYESYELQKAGNPIKDSPGYKNAISRAEVRAKNLIKFGYGEAILTGNEPKEEKPYNDRFNNAIRGT